MKAYKTILLALLVFCIYNCQSEEEKLTEHAKSVVEEYKKALYSADKELIKDFPKYEAKGDFKGFTTHIFDFYYGKQNDVGSVSPKKKWPYFNGQKRKDLLQAYRDLGIVGDENKLDSLGYEIYSNRPLTKIYEKYPKELSSLQGHLKYSRSAM